MEMNQRKTKKNKAIPISLKFIWRKFSCFSYCFQFVSILLLQSFFASSASHWICNNVMIYCVQTHFALHFIFELEIIFQHLVERTHIYMTMSGVHSNTLFPVALRNWNVDIELLFRSQSSLVALFETDRKCAHSSWKCFDCNRKCDHCQIPSD